MSRMEASAAIATTANDGKDAGTDDDRDVVGLGLFEQVKTLLGQITALAQDHLSLAALETRRAGEALISALVMSLLAVCLAVVAWLALLAAALIFLVQNQWFSPMGGMLLVAALHCLCVFLLVRKVRAQTRLLMFPATLNSFAKQEGEGF